MKASILTVGFLILIFPQFGNCQNSKLDEKNGLYDFKFGSSFELFKANLDFELEGEDGVKYYKYKGTKYTSILGDNYDKLIIGFYKNKLYFINIDFYFINIEFEKSFLSKMNDFFGKGIRASTNGQAAWGYYWETDKIFMQLAKGQYANLDSAAASKTTLMLYSKIIKKQILNDGF